MSNNTTDSVPKIDELIRAVDVKPAIVNDNEQKDDEKNANKVFTANNMSNAVRNAKYAVRGDIVQRAHQIAANLSSKNNNKHPFNKVIFCNIGNPQAFCAPPITFHRQVLACIMYPPLMDEKPCKFPNDVITRAKCLLNATAHYNIGAYTNSRGLKSVRASVANFLKQRDGFAGDINNIFLTNGASTGIKFCLKCLISCASDGILIPIPQYPLYSATITLNSGIAIPYELDENNDWNADLESIETAITNAKQNGINCKGIVIINPGNPTGQCISEQVIKGIINIANKYNIVILADEVYQENIYYKDKYPFISVRKCLLTNELLKNSIELISFHSVSKGIFSECGLRGGYMELINISKTGVDMIVKLASINLCPNTIGQCMVDLMVNTPKNGDESFKLFKQEYDKQYKSLQERAQILTKELNNINGISCNTVYGALYAFPNIKISNIVVENVRNEYKNDKAFNNKEVDFIYCMELLENFGICVIPGSGFGQKNQTFHFRTTVLPPKDQINKVVESLALFHKMFIKKYS